MSVPPDLATVMPARRRGEQTAFEVIKGDHKLVARRDIGTEGVELKASSAFIQTDRSPEEVQQQKQKYKK